MVDRKEVCVRSEAAVTEVLRARGYVVTNLNELTGNCPFMDLLARKGADRLLIQVKGTTTDWGGFTTPPHTVWALHRFATELDCPALYAFVHFVTAEPVIRFATAADVALLAEEDEAANAGKNRFHVRIDQFPIDVDHLDILYIATGVPVLTGSRPPRREFA
jgi:hypothetical protein